MPDYGGYEESDIKKEMKEVALRILTAGKYALEESVNISGLSLQKHQTESKKVVKKLQSKREEFHVSTTKE